MINRRRVLKILGTAGIGTAVFRRAMAAKAGDGPVTREMVADAEWVAGIKLTDAQRETAVNVLNKWAREEAKRIRAIEVDNSLLPGLNFAPLASPASLPDPRGYEVVKSPEPVHDPVGRPNSDEDLAFSSIKHLGALLRSRKISSVELTKFYLDRLHRYDPLLKCVVTYMDDLALKQAEQADQELLAKKDRGPLHGIPWGVKDRCQWTRIVTRLVNPNCYEV
jgi:Amidase